MSSPLSRASSRWLIISLCRKSSTGIVPLLPVLVVSGLYASPEAFQEDFVSTALTERGDVPPVVGSGVATAVVVTVGLEVAIGVVVAAGVDVDVGVEAAVAVALLLTSSGDNSHRLPRM